MGLSKIHCIYVIAEKLGGVVGLLTEGAVVMSDTFASLGDSFPPPGLSHPALVFECVPSCIVTCYIMFG